MVYVRPLKWGFWWGRFLGVLFTDFESWVVSDIMKMIEGVWVYVRNVLTGS